MGISEGFDGIAVTGQSETSKILLYRHIAQRIAANSNDDTACFPAVKRNVMLLSNPLPGRPGFRVEKTSEITLDESSELKRLCVFAHHGLQSLLAQRC